MSEPDASAAMGRVEKLYLNVRTRAPLEDRREAQFRAGTGIDGDRHRKDGRQVLLVEAETINEFGLAPGDLRENVVVRGLPLMPLPPGTRLRAGECEIEIVEPCAPCERMDEIRPGLQAALEGRRGVLARVVRSGTVRVGDAVRVAGSPTAP